MFDRCSILLLSFGSLSFPLLAQQQSTHYELRFDNAVHHEAEIRATFYGVTGASLLVQMSRSSPGRYALHEFAKNVYKVRASDPDGHPLPITRPNPYSWCLNGVHGAAVVSYTLFGDRVDGTYAGIDATHAHLNLPAALMWASGFEHSPSVLHFHTPPGSHWRVATQLFPRSDGSWSAPNLEQLMDSPVEISEHAEPEWTIENARFRLSLHHLGTDAEAAAFAEMCQAVVLEEEGVFGSFPQYDNGSYTFLVDYLPWASYDGMEHRDSTVITGSSQLKGASAREIGTVSHEFFHSWNVRRIRPKSLEPFDFERVDMSGELWFAEGFTNYYGILVLKRAGLWSLDEFAGAMGDAVNTVLTAPGRKVHDVVEMSELAPFVDAAKSIDPNNFRNTFISYYTYGQALALALDLQIRKQFPGKTLDDWMRVMWREHPDIEKPYALADLQNSLGETTGSDEFARNFFQKHIVGTEPIDFSPLLSQAGLLLRKQQAGAAWLGSARLNYSDGGFEIESETLRGSPLYDAGLDKGDRIVRWDGKLLSSSAELKVLLARRSPGDPVRLEAETRSGRRTLDLILAENPALEVVTFEQAGIAVAPEITAFRKSWLASKALHPLPKIGFMP